MKKTKSPHEIASELRHYFDQRGAKSSLRIAKLCNIGQTQVYRNLFGKPKRITETLKKLCEYANISIYADVDLPDPSSSATLMAALAEIWDGSEAHARRISRLLFALKQVDV